MPYRWRQPAVAAGILAMAACSELPTEDPAPKRIPSMGVAAGPPTAKPNSQKYRQQTVGHATGRSGSAQITARALLGKDGGTAVEVTTGTLDQGGAPGDISKVQLKFFHPGNPDAHEPTFNDNQGNGTGYWTRQFSGKVRHQRMQAQTNVRGIDRNRTDVVTVTERVNLRPDIAVSSLNAPASAYRGTNVPIHSSISEMNGDVGATTNCVMYINGAATDRANGVWVANGDLVVCAFAHTFNSVGTFDITVKAEAVVPGDWDLANNSRSVRIEIVDPALHGSASAYQGEYTNDWYNYGYSSRQWCWYYYSDYGCNGNSDNWSNRGYYVSRDQSSWISGWTPANWQYPITVSARHGTDGWTTDWRGVNLGWTGGNYGYVNWPGYSIYTQSYPGWGSNIWIQRWAGYAYYFSEYYYQSWWWWWNCSYYYGCNGSSGPGYGYYYVNGPYWNQWGTYYSSYGNSVFWDIDIYTANGVTFTADATIPLTTWYDSWYYQPWQCDYNSWSSYYYWEYYNRCYYSYYRNTYKSGWTSF